MVLEDLKEFGHERKRLVNCTRHLILGHIQGLREKHHNAKLLTCQRHPSIAEMSCDEYGNEDRDGKADE